jgi:hypothetical protein
MGAVTELELGSGRSSAISNIRRSTSRVSDVEDVDDVSADGEENPIDVRSTAIEKLPHFRICFSALWRDRAASRKSTKGLDRLAKSREPPCSRIASFLAYEPGVNRSNV